LTELYTLLACLAENLVASGKSLPCFAGKIPKGHIPA
jgi:hypothetical protein